MVAPAGSRTVEEVLMVGVVLVMVVVVVVAVLGVWKI